MSRDPTWAATSVPEIRSRWCNALDALADRQTEIIESPPEGGVAAGVAKRIERLPLMETAHHTIDRRQTSQMTVRSLTAGGGWSHRRVAVV